MKLFKILFLITLFIFPIAEVGKIQFGSVSVTVNDAFLFLTFITWLVSNYKQKNLVKGDLKKPIIIFVCIGFVALLLNLYRLNINSFTVSFLYLARWILYSSIYFMLIGLDKKFIQNLKTFLIIPISVILILGIVQYNYYQSLRNLYYLGWDEHLYRLFSSFLDPNFAGAFLCLSFIFLLFLTWQSYKKKEKYKFIFICLLTLLNFTEIYVTFSRSALIMLAVSLITFLVLIGKKKFIIIFAVFIVLLALFSPKSFKTEGTNLFRIFSSEQRIESANAALKIIKNNFFIGVGFNAYRYVMYEYGIVNDAKWQTTHSGAGTDNSFLFVMATTGALGLLSYIYLLYKIIYLGRSKIKNNPFAVVLISIILGVIVDSLFVNSLFYVYVMEFIWIYAGITENS
jgi:O-antigen ligase